MARYVDLIYKKRYVEEHTKEEIQQIIKGVITGEMPDYQISAWLMAVCLNGMSLNETAQLTDAMVKSGDIMDLSSLGDYVIDKHSTGGVGDKTTLVLCPLLASVGLPIAKLSGRGLGHTGGTVDKLESIPGFNISIPTDKFLEQVKKYGIAIGGQTAKLVPADGIIYALRDVTATVESIPLMAASVVSKKIASGANVIILDVKYGTGAFMQTVEEAEKLAEVMVEVGNRLNKYITCVVTSMEQPLGKAIGHTLEVIEAIETLKNRGPDDLTEICLTLGAVALNKAKIVKNINEGKDLLAQNLSNGKALQKFRDLIKAQNGDVSVLEDYSKFQQAKIKLEYKSKKEGYVSKCDALYVAKACKVLGAGRDKKDDPVNLAVGVVVKKKISDFVSSGDVLAEIYADDEFNLEQSIEFLNKAYEINAEKPAKPILINKMIGV